MLADGLQDGGRLPGVGLGGDEQRPVIERDARSMHQRVTLADERPAQQRLDHVGVQHVGRLAYQRRGIDLGGRLAAVDDNAEPEPPRHLVVDDRLGRAVLGRVGHNGDIVIRLVDEGAGAEVAKLRQAVRRANQDDVVDVIVIDLPARRVPDQPVGDGITHHRQGTQRDEIRQQVVHAQLSHQQRQDRPAQHQQRVVHGEEAGHPLPEVERRLRAPAEDPGLRPGEIPEGRALRGEHRR